MGLLDYPQRSEDRTLIMALVNQLGGRAVVSVREIVDPIGELQMWRVTDPDGYVLQRKGWVEPQAPEHPDFPQISTTTWEKALRGDTEAIGEALWTMDQRARILGIKVPDVKMGQLPEDYGKIDTWSAFVEDVKRPAPDTSWVQTEELKKDLRPQVRKAGGCPACVDQDRAINRAQAQSVAACIIAGLGAVVMITGELTRWLG